MLFHIYILSCIYFPLFWNYLGMKIQPNFLEKDTEIEVSSTFLKYQVLSWEIKDFWSDQRAIAEGHAAYMKSESYGCCWLAECFRANWWSLDSSDPV